MFRGSSLTSLDFDASSKNIQLISMNEPICPQSIKWNLFLFPSVRLTVTLKISRSSLQADQSFYVDPKIDDRNSVAFIFSCTVTHKRTHCRFPLKTLQWWDAIKLIRRRFLRTGRGGFCHFRRVRASKPILFFFNGRGKLLRLEMPQNWSGLSKHNEPTTLGKCI